MEQRKQYYEQFVQSEIDRETFLTSKADCAARIDKLNRQVAIIRQAERDNKSAQKTAALASHVISEEATPKKIVDTLIEKIIVSPGNNIEIRWKIDDFAKMI
jgi:hypothetical protein